MTDSIKKLCGLRPHLTHEIDALLQHGVDPFTTSVFLTLSDLQVICAAIRDLEGVASGTHVIVPVEVLLAIEPHLDAIVCYASTMREHPPNKAVQYIRAMLSAVEKKEANPRTGRFPNAIDDGEDFTMPIGVME